jgi:hypothetical protein
MAKDTDTKEDSTQKDSVLALYNQVNQELVYYRNLELKMTYSGCVAMVTFFLTSKYVVLNQFHLIAFKAILVVFEIIFFLLVEWLLCKAHLALNFNKNMRINLQKHLKLNTLLVDNIIIIPPAYMEKVTLLDKSSHVVIYSIFLFFLLCLCCLGICFSK